MPYGTINDLPDNVKNVLPEHAKRIFMEAYNNAYDEYQKPSERRGNESLEEVTNKVAWSAVKRTYTKGDDDKWRQKKDS